MSNAQDLTKETFESTIGSGVTLVDFWAEWCAPCRLMTPVLDDLAATYDGKVTIGKINVDNEGELAGNYDVSSIPTLLVFKDGELSKRFVGVTSKEDLVAAITEAGA
jgi:thioredoxin 1